MMKASPGTPELADDLAPISPPAPATRPRRYAQLIVVLGALIALGPLSIDMYLPALPALSEDLAASDAAVQVTLTGMLLGLGFGQLLLGPISDAVGRRRPLLVGVAVYALASVLAALAPNVVVLSGVRLLQGFAGAAIAVTVMATVRDLFSGVAAARMLSRLILVMGAAPILAPTLGGLVLQWSSWRGIFVVLAVAASLLLVVAFFGLQETLPVDRRRSARPAATVRTYVSLLRDKTFVALVLIAGLVFSAMFAYIAGSSFVLQGIYGLDEQTFAVAFGLNASGFIVLSQLNPLLLRRFRPSRVLTFAVSMQTVAGVILVFNAATGVGGLFGVLVPLAVLVSGTGLALPNTPALALSRHGEAAGTASAMLGSVQFGVGSFVAPMVGMLGTSSAVPMAAIMLTVVGLAALLLYGIVLRDPTLEQPA